VTASARPIFLLGMMGAGKTTVGRLLAGSRGAVFIDLDLRIERMFAATIPALFERGEAYFRGRERLALSSLLREPGFAGTTAVVATGGGVVSDAANLDDILAVGWSVYLELSPEQLAARLSTPEQLASRPLLDADPTERLRSLSNAREQAYRRANVTIDADAAPEQVAARVVHALSLTPQSPRTM